MTKTIVVATDGSEGADTAVRQAAATAASASAKLFVLTVAPRGDAFLELGSSTEEITEYARSEHLAGGVSEAKAVLAEQILAGAQRIVGPQAELDVSYISCAGDPAEEIVAFASKHSADALYMGSRGLNSVGGFFLGSVSRRVRASAPCHVVIVSKHNQTL